LRSQDGDPLFSKEGGRIDTTLTMRCAWQLVATGGNGFGSFLRVPLKVDLRSVATGCNHRAP